MLQHAVEQGRVPLPTWQSEHAEHLEQVQFFLSQPYAGEARTWKEVFASQPPRRALVRLCRVFKADEHETVGFRNFRSKKEYRCEVRRLYSWYRRGRRKTRHRFGRFLRGRRLAFTAKTKRHCRNLRSRLKVRGLWNWRSCALHHRSAGLAVRKGTLPNERFWAVMSGYLPQASRQVSLRLFKMLAKLVMVRFNWALYAGHSLSPLAERDASMENMFRTVEMLQEGRVCACLAQKPA